MGGVGSKAEPLTTPTFTRSFFFCDAPPGPQPAAQLSSNCMYVTERKLGHAWLWLRRDEKRQPAPSSGILGRHACNLRNRRRRSASPVFYPTRAPPLSVQRPLSDPSKHTHSHTTPSNYFSLSHIHSRTGNKYTHTPHMKALTLISALAAASASLTSSTTHARLDWGAVTDRSRLQNGQQTYYGQDPDQDHQGACSLSENAANFNALPWTRGVHVTVALNRPQLDNSKGCGMCIMFRAQPGAGGLGMTALPAGMKGERGLGRVGLFLVPHLPFRFHASPSFISSPCLHALSLCFIPPGAWFRGFVNNECSDPGCVLDSAIDLNINGDGR